jgi:hypothetical protein
MRSVGKMYNFLWLSLVAYKETTGLSRLKKKYHQEINDTQGSMFKILHITSS